MLPQSLTTVMYILDNQSSSPYDEFTAHILKKIVDFIHKQRSITQFQQQNKTVFIPLRSLSRRCRHIVDENDKAITITKLLNFECQRRHRSGELIHI